ncbi:NAD(P)/FAD-dependent oxidoreductase [Brevibacillus sp. TJ4]|uniref:NAD(P)/FAD-dependent oxidoreductase n=1 Tax=Brevibacillus sp. TJ4 TaxID=3234853 RepID=UPI0037D5420D
MIYDTIVIGAGIAGLQTAIQLARCLRKVAVIDIPGGRSAVAKCYHNILGFPSGVSGDTLRRSGKEQAQRYGAAFFTDEVVAVKHDEKSGFTVQTKNAASLMQGRTLVLATGIRDPFPAIEGVRECLGQSVFLCPDCDGYESVGKKTAIVGAGPNAIAMIDELIGFTRSLFVINHTGDSVESGLVDKWNDSIPIWDTRVIRFVHTHGQLVALELYDGRRLEVSRAFLAFPGAHVQTDLIRAFRVRLTDKGHVIVNPRTRETDHPDLWAVGDVVNHSQQVAIAMGDGAQAAIWIHKRLREREAHGK